MGCARSICIPCFGRGPACPPTDGSARVVKDDARRAAVLAARASYGRLLAMLVSWSRDIAGAEDALAEAFTSAVAIWPERGVPANPEAWLLTSARNRLRNSYRHNDVKQAAQQEL